MAANKFATMLYRNTNKITLILIYAVLEWILILLLLLNSLFSYLIIKFAEFFGLQPPCLWCTRLDHKNMHRDLLCEIHAREISKLGYCSNHHKLAESQDMCEHCLSSRPAESQGFSKIFSLFPWILEEFGVTKEKVGKNGEVSSKCCCCGVRLDNTMYPSNYHMLLKTTSFWDVLECAQKENLITKDGDLYDNHIDSDQKMLGFSADLCDNEKFLEDKNESEMVFELDESEMELTEKERNENGCVEEDSPVEISPQHLEFFLDCSGHKLVPVELANLITEENRSKDNVKIGDCDKSKDQGSNKVCEVEVEEEEDLAMNRSRLDEMEVVLDLDINEEHKFATLDSMELEEDENSLIFHAKDCNFAMEEFEPFTSFQVSRLPDENVRDVREMAVAAQELHLNVHTASQEVAQMDNNENEADVSIGTDIPDLDITNEIVNQESVRSYECTHEDPLARPANLDEADDHGLMQVKEQMVELQCVSVQDREDILNNQPSLDLELNEIEEDKIPDTPTSMDGLNQLHNKLGFHGKRDCDESLDESATSELEGSDGAVTIEGLKTALRAERKNLQALYAELEEERSASAVAANQTMAMINRLQEEKAALQMEALQYQRMMEEQCEYDQEALQLMNELMVKRAKEKQELEKELEVYRKKLLHYESKEKIRVFKKSNGSTRSGFSSASCSNSRESDGLSVHLNQEAKEEEGSHSHEESGNNDSTVVDTVMNLEESLADFEEGRLSILAQLKVLEEKLIVLDDDSEQQLEDVEAMGDFPEENGKHEDENAHFNSFVKEMNGKHHQKRRIACQKGKSLPPLFDATSNENGDILSNGNGFDLNGAHSPYVSKFEMESKNLGIEEEVDQLYERLQGPEDDKEFIKHCVSSLLVQLSS